MSDNRKKREHKLRAALTDYFMVKVMEDVDMVMSDSAASSIAEILGGTQMSLDIPYEVLEDARKVALERLKAQGYEVKLDEEEPGVYYHISRKEPDEKKKKQEKNVTEIHNEFQTLLKTYLESHPGSARQLADEFRTAVGTLTRWVNGYSKPPPQAMKAIIANLKRKMQTG